MCEIDYFAYICTMNNDETQNQLEQRDKKPDRAMRFLRNLVILLLAVLVLLIVEYNRGTSFKSGVRYSNESVDKTYDSWFDDEYDDSDDDEEDDDDATPSGIKVMDKELQKFDPHVH